MKLLDRMLAPFAGWFFARSLRRNALAADRLHAALRGMPTMPSSAGAGSAAPAARGAEPRPPPPPITQGYCRLSGCGRRTTDARGVCVACQTDPRLHERLLHAFADKVLLERPEWP